MRAHLVSPRPLDADATHDYPMVVVADVARQRSCGHLLAEKFVDARIDGGGTHTAKKEPFVWRVPRRDRDCVCELVSAAWSGHYDCGSYMARA